MLVQVSRWLCGGAVPFGRGTWFPNASSYIYETTVSERVRGGSPQLRSFRNGAEPLEGLDLRLENGRV